MFKLDKCLDIISKFEGCNLHPYPDPATGDSPITIGYGSIRYLDGSLIKLSDPAISSETALEMLTAHINQIINSIDKLIEVDLSENQLSAIISLVYNIGLGNFRKSTLLKLLNSGEFDRAASQFLVWNKANRQIMKGLTNRRIAEKELFLS